MLMYLWGEWTLNFMSDTKNVLIRGGGGGGGGSPCLQISNDLTGARNYNKNDP